MDEADTPQSRRKYTFLGILILCAIVVVCVGTTECRDAVPDRARFVYDSKFKIIVPEPVPGQFVFFPIDGVSGRWNGFTTYGEIHKKGSRFLEFSLPKGEGWDTFTLAGPSYQLWRKWVLPPESRWDEKGYWRY